MICPGGFSWEIRKLSIFYQNRTDQFTDILAMMYCVALLSDIANSCTKVGKTSEKHKALTHMNRQMAF